MSLVLDTSIVLAWTYAEETTQPVLQVFEMVKAEGAWVPALWRWEMANVLQTNVRRGRHGQEFRDNALAALTLLPIHVGAECAENAWLNTVSLAERHRLTIYDAAYLELAIRRKIPLATLDRELRAAAESEEVKLLGA